MTSPDPYRLPPTVVPSRYDLTLEPDLQAATFAGEVSIDVTISEPVTEVRLNASELTIDTGWLESADGTRVEASVELHPELEQASLSLAGTADPGRWTVHARFAGVLNDKLTGFYRSTFTAPDGQSHTIATTQFEATYARKAFPCWDEPERKAVFAVTLVVPDDLLAISNAAETSSEQMPDGRRAVHFADTIQMSTYLVAFVVGPLEATDPVDVDGTPLRVVYPPGRGDLTAFALEAGAFAVRHLAGYYGIPYPGDKLDLVAIPDFSFGAMENLGCVTFRETLLLIDPARVTQAELQRVVDVVAHEIAHMWFGDLVTMKWWNGIWLNEAFATFMEMLVTDAFRPDWDRWTDFGIARSAAFDTDSLSTTRPIEYEVVSPADAEGMFDVLTYEKGAAVLWMLEQYLGPNEFRSGIGRYLQTHAFANTETTDLWDAIEEEVDEPTRRMMDSWIFQAGHPVVTAALTDDGRTAHLTQSRFRFAADGETTEGGAIDRPAGPTWAVPVVLRVGRNGTTETHKVLLDGETVAVDLGEPAEWVLGNHRGTGFYRTAYDDALLDRLASRAQRDLTPLERYGLVEDSWGAVLAARTSVDRLLGLLRAFSEEPDLSVWQRVAGVLGALERLVDEQTRPRFSGFVRSLVGPAAKRLGTEPTAGEPDRVASLRALLFETLCQFGDDDVEKARAADLFERLGQDQGTVDPELASASVRIVAAGADAACFDELWARSKAASTPQDKMRYLGALADVTDPGLFDRFLAMTLTDDVRTQDAALLLRRALVNRANGDRAWAFITTNWDTLNARLPSAGIPRMIDGISVVNEVATADGIEAFLRSHPVPQGTKKVDQYLERMRVNVALRAREATRLSDALGDPGPHGPAASHVTVFAVEDATVQLTWAALGPGPVRISAAHTRVDVMADGGPGAVVLGGLLPDRAVDVVLAGVGVPGGRLVVPTRTLRPPPGAELFRLATISDLHLGAMAFGYRRTIVEQGDPTVPHPERCSAAAISELQAWGAERLIVKGDITDQSQPHNWKAFGRLVDEVAIPLDVLAGNHDHGTRATVPALAGLRTLGLEMVEGVTTVDVPGLRLVLVDSTQPGHHHGRVAHLTDDVVAALHHDRGGTLVAMHHHLQPHRVPEGWPFGVPKVESRRFLDVVGAANPNTLITSGHTHQHRRWRRGPVTITQVGSTKDYPGVWAGYVVYEGGIRQVVRRVMQPDCIQWTERTKAAVFGLWGRTSPGRLDARCFSLDWAQRP